jgi:predicted O-methyltransferase YrrM
MSLASPEIVERLVSERPSFHSLNGGDRIWHAQPRTLELIGRYVRPGDRTLETGCGASTVVFAAAGAHHTAISPSPSEHERIRAYCSEVGIDDGGLSFVADSSDRALPSLAADEALDVAFIDGAHSFPFPVIDWHYVSRRLRTGGILIMDDVNIPAVAVAYSAMTAEPGAWRLLVTADDRAAAFQKLAECPAGDNWRAQGFNSSYPDYSFVPAGRRARLLLRHRLRTARSRLGSRFPALRRLARRHLRR